MTSTTPLAAVFGCAGPELQPDEAEFFRANSPLGFILFARNCDNPAQIRRLAADLRATVDEFRADEIEHHDTGIAHGAEQAPGFELMSGAIRAGTKLAIWLSTRV